MEQEKIAEVLEYFFNFKGIVKPTVNDVSEKFGLSIQETMKILKLEPTLRENQ